MASTSTHKKLPHRPFKWLLLTALFCLGVWFLANEIAYAVTRDRAGEPMLRSAVLAAHLVSTLPLLLLPPWQFSRRVRARWPNWHRRAGQVYLAGAVVAAMGAMYLGLTFESAGRRVPLFVFATLWLAFSAAAWVCARRRAFAAHERFIVRSYAIALAFVFVRVMAEAQESMFAFLPDAELRGVTREWLSFVIPLLAVEGWYSWWPAVRSALPSASSKRSAD
jgi:hypothetical protein